jgi:hypothetical protein
MIRPSPFLVTCAAILTLFLLTPVLAFAQGGYQAPRYYQTSDWSVDASVGWDIGLSGSVLAPALGSIDGRPVVIDRQKFNDVYGTGIFWQFGVGYALNEYDEVRGTFTYQRSSADLRRVGTISNAPLVATFDTYQVVGLDVGIRRYFDTDVRKLRPFVGASLGLAVIPEIDGQFAAPDLGLTLDATDFYDGTAAFTFGVNGGALYRLGERVDAVGQLGFRFTSGLKEVDQLIGNGLEAINDDSSRWALPFTVGIRYRF